VATAAYPAALDSLSPNVDRFTNEVPLREAALVKHFNAIGIDSDLESIYRGFTSSVRPEVDKNLRKLTKGEYPEVNKLSPMVVIQMLRDLQPEIILKINSTKPDYIPKLIEKALFEKEASNGKAVDPLGLSLGLKTFLENAYAGGIKYTLPPLYNYWLTEFGEKASDPSQAKHIWANETGIRAKFLDTLALGEIGLVLRQEKSVLLQKLSATQH